MSFTVEVKPGDKSFSVDADETVLEAALRQGVGLPYGCKDGACGACRGKVVSGDVMMGDYQPKALSAADRDNGYVLFCRTHACSDLVIEARVAGGTGEFPVRKMPCRVQSLTFVAPDVAIMTLQLPTNERLQFLAGQYLDILMKDGRRRSYSMANAPFQEGAVELHIRHLPGGAFTDAVFGAKDPALKVKDLLRFEGPQGSFFLQKESHKPMVLLASGTGFAPIQSLVEQAEHDGVKRPMTLYWGGRRPQDLYRRERIAEWEARMPHFKFVPVISDALPEDRWGGRTGFVHRAVVEDFPDLSGHEVYACGAPIVIESARRDFVAVCGLPETAFIADSFVSEADGART